MKEITLTKLKESFEIKSVDSKFEQIWIRCNVKEDYDADNELSDYEYIMYSVWTQFNDERLYEKYLPKTNVWSGSMNRTDKIIFHGGCLNCISQSIHNINRCADCKYFRANWSKKDLTIKIEEQ